MQLLCVVSVRRHVRTVRRSERELPPPLPNESHECLWRLIHQCHWTISYDTSDVPHRQRSSGSTLRGTVWCAPALSRPVLEGICAMQHQRSMRAAWVLGRLFRASPSQHQAHPHSDVRGVQRLLSTAGVAVPRTSDGAAADVTMPSLVGGARPRGGEGCAVVTSTSRRTASTLQPGTGRCLTHTAALPALAHPRLSIAHRGLQREAGLFATTEDQRQSQTLSEQRGKADLDRLGILFSKRRLKSKTTLKGKLGSLHESASVQSGRVHHSHSHASDVVRRRGSGWEKYTEAADIFHLLLVERRLEMTHLNIFLKNCFSSERQLQLVELARRLEMTIDDHTVGTVVSRLLIEGDAARARETGSEMESLLADGAGVGHLRLLKRGPEELVRMRVALADRWIQLGHPGAIALRELIDKLLACGLQSDITALFNVALKQRGLSPRAAQRLVDSMWDDRVPRDEVTYSTLLNVYRLHGVDGSAARTQAEMEGLARVDVGIVMARPEAKYNVTRGQMLRDLHSLRGPTEYTAAWRLYFRLRSNGKATSSVVLSMLGAAATSTQFSRLLAHLAESESTFEDETTPTDAVSRTSASSQVVVLARDPSVHWCDVKDTNLQRFAPLFEAARKWHVLDSVDPAARCSRAEPIDGDAVADAQLTHLHDLFRWGLHREALRLLEVLSQPLDYETRAWVLDQFAAAGEWHMLDKTFRLELASEVAASTLSGTDEAVHQAAPAEFSTSDPLTGRQQLHTIATAAVVDFRHHLHVGPVVATLRAALAHVRDVSITRTRNAGGTSIIARTRNLLADWRRPARDFEAAWMSNDLVVLVDNDTVAVAVDATFAQLEPPVTVTWLSRVEGKIEQDSLHQWATTSVGGWATTGGFAPQSAKAVLRWP